MFEGFQLLTLLLVAIAMATSLAHALEMPGKLRLPKDAYVAMQPIYYPGFTIAGGVGEGGGIVATLLLVLLFYGKPGFWLTLGALLSLLVMHGLYWVLTHPVNNFWLKDTKLKGAGAAFFSIGAERARDDTASDWKRLRDRWEYSHVARAIFAMLAFLLLATALVVR